MMARQEYHPTTAVVKRETSLVSSYPYLQPMPCTRKHKKRFSDEQIKSLEIIFACESRPETSMKQQLANELGLQHRQVAIWFQNKRARLKTKHTAHEYSILKDSYASLACKVESLKQENQLLLIQLLELRNGLTNNTENGNYGHSEGETSSSSSKYANVSNLFVDWKNDHVELNNENGRSTTCNEAEPADDAFLTSENWSSLGSSSLLEESSTSSHWWEHWS